MSVQTAKTINETGSRSAVTAEPFRRYKIIRKLAVGGMGEIFLARQTGIEGFAKDVVIKRISSHYATEPLFVNLFLQEARIAALLDHPNIVQIYELGKQDDTYFIVMEYVPGWSLSRILESVQGPLPLTIALQIAAAVAEGLQFVHEKRDSKGQALHLVHRDISPPNILLSTSGNVKITDFGIAKARTSSAYSQAGEIKGKYAYLSPEQACGDALDHRSDIYSLGLVLYEMTTGTKAYDGTYIDVLHAAGHGEYRPPAEVATEFPEDVQAVILRCLAFERDDRYESCRELQEDLLTLLVNRLEAPSSAKVGQFVRDLIQGDTADGQRRQEGTGKEAESRGGARRQGSDGKERCGRRQHTPSQELVFEELGGMDDRAWRREPATGSTPEALGEMSFAYPERRRGLAWIISAGSLVVLAVFVLVWILGGMKDDDSGAMSMPREVSYPAPKTLRFEKISTVIHKDVEPAESRSRIGSLSRTRRAALHHRRQGRTRSRTRRSHAPRSQQRTAKVSITTVPATEVYHGKRLLGRTPLLGSVPMGRITLTLRNRALGLRTLRTLEVDRETVRAHFTFQKGRVQFSVGPGRLVRLDGKLVGRTPLGPVEVYEGHHTITVVHPFRYEKKTIRVRVRGNETTWVSQVM